MMDCFSPIFPRLFVGTKKKKKTKKREKINFLLVGFTLFLSLREFLSGIRIGANYIL